MQFLSRVCHNALDCFDILKFTVVVRPRGHKQSKDLITMFIHFFRLCPLGLTIKLTYNFRQHCVALFTIYSHLRHNVIQRGCQAISGENRKSLKLPQIRLP